MPTGIYERKKGYKRQLFSEKWRENIGKSVKERYKKGEKFGFQEGHKSFKGIEKGQFKKGNISWSKLNSDKMPRGKNNHNWIDGRRNNKEYNREYNKKK